MIVWTHQQRVYPQWQAGQMSPAVPVYALPNSSIGGIPIPFTSGDDDGDYFYTITNW